MRRRNVNPVFMQALGVYIIFTEYVNTIFVPFMQK